MENIENLLNIYKDLRSCTNPDEVESLKKSLNRSNIHYKEVEKESDPDPCKNGGSKELGIRNFEKSRMSSLADKSKEVNKLIKDVKELAEIGKFGDDLTIEVYEEMQVKFPTSKLVGKKFEGYKNEISSLLTNNKASTIGVWGMGGVGKTTLLKDLHNLMLAWPHIYGYVYWITVSKDCSIQKLQTDIATRIGEPISNNIDESQRAGILAEALKRKKKFVMILDDMWSDYDLNEVGLGIPKEVGYRLIIISRSKNVCLKMYCDKLIKVNPLSKKDAWTLFVRSIGREIPANCTKISIDVLKECRGLPLGIVTLAKSMMGCNDVSEWSNVLDELRNSSGKVDDMEEKVFNVLRLSYERLKDCEAQKCLLYCATYPEDYHIEIDELIWLFIDVGLLGKNVGMAKMFNKGITILKKLERVALLSIGRDVYSKENKYVCLHDLIRDMALQIAGSRFMIKAGIELKNIPDEESWTKNIEVVSLMRNQIKEIFDFSPKCNKLSTLLLQGYGMRSVSDDFFSYLHGLKHLDLSHSGIRTLPKSISLLKNLTALILRDCWWLRNVPSLAKLTSLERLDLYKSGIIQLPKGIGCLRKLRYLNLFGWIKRIGAGVISKLTALQYLAINARFEVKELNSLNKLEHLSVQFEDFVSFLIFIEHMQIKGLPNSYFFILGKEMIASTADMSHALSEKKIYLSNVRLEKVCNLQKSKIYVSLYSKLKFLFGNHNASLEYSFSESRDNLHRSHEIRGSVKLFYENELQKILQDMDTLDVWEDDYMVSLGDFVFDTGCNRRRQSEIERGPQPFSNLKRLKLCKCSNLKKLFPLGLLSNFQNIEAIQVGKCEGLEELIDEATDETKSGGNGHPKILSLPKLNRINLKYLPNLKRLCGDDKVIRAPLQCMRIKGCSNLKRMPFDVDRQQHQPVPQIFYAKSEQEWFQALEWDPPESKNMIHYYMLIKNQI